MNIKTSLNALALTAGLLLAPVAAQAALINGSFDVTIDSAGPLEGQTFSGTFSFDDAAFGPGFGSDEASPLLSFSFVFAGLDVGLADLAYGDAVRPVGGDFSGLDALGAVFSFAPANGPIGASFLFDIPGVGAGSGGVSFVLEPGTVPEPGSFGLLALGLAACAGLGATRRRH